MELVRALNTIYKRTPALFTQDFVPEGFSWNKSDDADRNVLSFLRHSAPDADGNVETLMCVLNLGGQSHTDYTLGVPEAGTWKLLLNTDAAVFGGADNPLGDAQAVTYPWDGFDASVTLHLPAMSAQWYKLQR